MCIAQIQWAEDMRVYITQMFLFSSGKCQNRAGVVVLHGAVDSWRPRASRTSLGVETAGQRLEGGECKGGRGCCDTQSKKATYSYGLLV